MLRGLLLAMVSVTLIGPDIERGALSSLDAAEDVRAGVALDVGLLVQIGAHAGVVQPSGAGHARTPLRLHTDPAGPGSHVIRPEVSLPLGWRLIERTQARQGFGPGAAGRGCA